MIHITYSICIGHLKLALYVCSGTIWLQIHCMRYYKSASEILSASEKIASKMPYLPTWGPVVDGAMGFVPHLPQADRASGFFAPVPLMAGVVRDEGAHESQRYVPNIDSSPDFSESQWADGVCTFCSVMYCTLTNTVLVYSYKLSYSLAGLLERVNTHSNVLLCLFSVIVCSN